MILNAFFMRKILMNSWNAIKRVLSNMPTSTNFTRQNFKHIKTNLHLKNNRLRPFWTKLQTFLRLTSSSYTIPMRCVTKRENHWSTHVHSDITWWVKIGKCTLTNLSMSWSLLWKTSLQWQTPTGSIIYSMTKAKSSWGTVSKHIKSALYKWKMSLAT